MPGESVTHYTVWDSWRQECHTGYGIFVMSIPTAREIWHDQKLQSRLLWQMFTSCISRGGNAVSLVQSIPLFLLHWTKWLMIFIFVKSMGHNHSLLGIEGHRSALSVWPWSIAEIYMAVAPYGLQCFDVPRFIFCSIYHKLFVCLLNFPTYFLLLISFLIYFFWEQALSVSRPDIVKCDKTWL